MCWLTQRELLEGLHCDFMHVQCVHCTVLTMLLLAINILRQLSANTDGTQEPKWNLHNLHPLCEESTVKLANANTVMLKEQEH